jgi:hypothetical protein
LTSCRCHLITRNRDGTIGSCGVWGESEGGGGDEEKKKHYQKIEEVKYK